MTATDFELQMTRLTGLPDYEEIVFEEPMTPSQMANSLGSLTLEISAREATFTTCRDYIWTRLSGKRKRVDVLFRARRRMEAGKTEKFSVQ